MSHDSAGLPAEKWRRQSITGLSQLSRIPNSSMFIVAASVSMAVIVWFAYVEDMKTSGAWGCAMSWMTPRFVKQTGPPLGNHSRTLDKYDLYLYREDGWDLNDIPTGYPVIFLPGNAGSMKQCRSIASSAAKQFYDHPGFPSIDGNDGRLPYKPIDMFAIDFGEELSALHSPTLDHQAEYVARAIPHVLDLYNHLHENDRPRRVSLLGHSMGGIVAKLAMTFDGGPVDLVDGILTMSTPHAEPPFKLDSGMSALYQRVEGFWGGKSGGGLPPVISICGGAPDSQIPSEICILPATQAGASQGFTVFTTAIEGVWTGVEHQAMVWCHQVRLVVARLLLLSKRDPHPSFSRAAEELLITPKHKRAISFVTPPAHFSKIHHSQGVTKFTARAAERHILPLSPSNAHSLLCTFPINGLGPRNASTAHMQICAGNTHPENCSDSAGLDIFWLPRVEAERHFPGPEGVSGDDGMVLARVTSSNMADSSIVVTAAGTGTCFLQEDGDAMATTGSVLSQDWAASPGEGRHTQDIYLPKMVNSPLLAYTMTPGRLPGDCTHESMFSPFMRFTSSTNRERSYEHRFFPIAPSVTLHTHVQSEGSPSTVPKITIFQNPGDPCRVTSFQIRIHWAGSVAKSVLRLRASVVVWAIGMFALLMREQVRQQRALETSRTFVETMGRVSVRDCVVVWASTSLLGLLFAAPKHMFLGVNTHHFALLPASACLLIASVALTTLVGLILQHTARTSCQSAALGRVVRLSKRPVVEVGFLAVLAATVIPRQFCQLIILALIWSNGDERFSKLPLCGLLLLLSAYHLPIVGIWLREAWLNGHYRFLTDHDIIHILPTGVFYITSTFRPAIKLPIRALEYAAAMLAVYSFTLGSQYPALLPTFVEIIVLMSAFS